MNPTATQLRIAHRLAAVHSHEWACTLAENTAAAIVAIGGLDLLAAVVRKQNGNLWPGIDCPFIDDAGTIHHTTGTGRLRWEVEPDGYARLWLSRPGPATGETDQWGDAVRGPSIDVLCAGVGAPGPDGQPEYVVLSNPDGVFHERHLAILANAVDAAAPRGYGYDEFVTRLDLAVESVRHLAAADPAEETAPVLARAPDEPASSEDDEPKLVISRGTRRPAASDRDEVAS